MITFLFPLNNLVFLSFVFTCFVVLHLEVDDGEESKSTSISKSSVTDFSAATRETLTGRAPWLSARRAMQHDCLFKDFVICAFSGWISHVVATPTRLSSISY